MGLFDTPTQNKVNLLQERKQDKLLSLFTEPVTPAYEDQSLRYSRTPAQNAYGAEVVNFDWSQPSAEQRFAELQNRGKEAVAREGLQEQMFRQTEQQQDQPLSLTQAIIRGSQHKKDRVENLVDALQYGLGKKAAGIGDAIVETGVGLGENIYANIKGVSAEKAHEKFKQIMQSNKFTKNMFDKKGNFTGLDKYKTAKEYGYDQTLTQQAVEDWGRAYDSGSVWEMAKSVARNIDKAPEFIMESAGEFATAPMRGVGILLNTFDYANNTLERRKEVTGKEISGISDVGAAALAGWGQAVINKYGVDEMIGRTNIVGNVVSKLADMAPEKLTKGVIQGALGKVGKALTVATGKGIYEGTEEVIQQMMEIVGAKIGTDKANEIFSDATGKELFQAFGGGFAAGAGMRAPMAVKDVASAGMSVANKGLDTLAEKSTGETVQSIRERQATEYVDEQKAKDAEYAQTVEDINAKYDTEPTVMSREDTIKSEIDEWTQVAREAHDIGDTTMVEEAFNNLQNLKAELDTLTPNEQFSKEMESKGVSKDEIDVYLHKSGIADTITQADREAGLGMELNDTNVRGKVPKGKKDKLYDPMMADNDMINSIVESGFDVNNINELSTKNENSTFLKRLSKHFGYKSAKHTQLKEEAGKISEQVKSNKEVQKALQDLSPNNATPAQAIRAIATAVATIRSATTSEHDIATKAGVKPVGSARMVGTDVQVGKAFINSFGMKLTGKDEVQLAKKYQEVGKKVLALAEAAGYIETTKGEFAVHNLINKKGEKISRKDVPMNEEYDEKSNTFIGTGVKVKGDVEAGRIPENALGDMFSSLNKIFNPINEEVPSAEPTDVIPSESPIAKEHEDIIKAMNEMKFHIKPEFIQLLTEIRDMAVDKNYDGLLSSDEQIKKLLGLDKRSTLLTKMSDSGRAINRKGNLVKLLENLDELIAMSKGEGFNYSSESAINQRIHIMQTVLEFQGDKFMARQMVHGGEYTTNGKQEFNLLVEDLADELGTKNIEDILNPTGDLKVALDAIKDDGTMTIQNMNYNAGKLGFSSPFKMLSVLNGIKDVQKAKVEGKEYFPVKTTYVPSSDATASGVMNTLLNLSGIKAVRDVLDTMGIGKKDSKFDPYTRLLEMVDISGISNPETKNTLEQMFKILYPNKRDMAKSPVMTWIYGQHNKNTERSMGDSIAIDLIKKAMSGDKEALKWVNKLTGRDYSHASVGNMSFEQKDLLVNHFTEHVGKVYVPQLKKAFPAVADYREKMGAIYKMLQQTGTWDGRIASAMDKMLGGKEYKMSVRKLKSMLINDDGEMLQVDKMMDNATSFNVNLQHSVDAALLLLSMKKVLGMKGLEVNAMTVHDAVYANPAVLMEVMKEYDRLTVEVAQKYDFLSVALETLEESINKMTDKAEQDIMRKSYNTLLKSEIAGTTIEQMIKDKQEYLKGLDVRVLGNKGLDLKDETGKEERTVTPKKESKPSIASQLRGKNLKKNLHKVVSGMDNLSKEYKALQKKILKALDGNVIEFYKSESFEGGQGAVGISTSAKDYRHTSTGKPMTAEAFLETVAHEIDHAYKLNYIENVGKNSTEVKYLQKVVEHLGKLEGLSKEAQNRIDYVLSREGARQVTELVAILENEPSTAKEIQARLAGNRLIEMLKGLLDKIRAWVNSLSTEAREELISKAMDKPVSVSSIQAALAQVEANAKVNDIFGNGDTKANVVADPYKKEYRNPVDIANDMIANTNSYVSDWMIIFGDKIATTVGPIAGKLHEETKAKYPIYASTVSMIRTGFYESGFAQKMHQALGINGDSKRELLDKVQTLGTNVYQESQKYLEKMGVLDRKLKSEYSKKELLKLYGIFAKTGIANLVSVQNEAMYKALMSGEITIDEALQEVGKDFTIEQKNQLVTVANYWLKGETTNTAREVNVKFVMAKDEDTARTYATLKALSKIKGGLEMLQNMDQATRQEMMELASANKHLNDVINEKKKDYTGKHMGDDAMYYGDYDGNYNMDVFDTMNEFAMVTKQDMRGSKYSSDNGWVVIKEPEGDMVGLVARENFDATSTRGVGLEVNRFANGIYLDPKQSKEVDTILEAYKTTEAKRDWLDRNSIVYDNGRYRFLLSEEVKKEKLGLVQNPAQALYRTFIHNFEVVHMQSVKDIILNEGVQQIDNEKDMELLNAALEYNHKQGLLGNRKPINPFLKVNYDFVSYDKLGEKYPYVKQYFTTPRNLSTYNDFNKNVTFVKKGEADVLLGHKNASIFGDSENRTLAKWEQMFKKMIILAKQKMIVTAPAKLAMDFVSNVGILSMHDMSPMDIYKGFRNGFDDYHQLSEARNEMIMTQMEARMAYNAKDMKKHEQLMKKIEKQQEAITRMPFYDAWKAGFVQSYSTDLVIKEFDTITGIQKDIDNFIDKITTDDKGNPNALYNAIKKWQAFGGEKFNIDSLFMAMSKKLEGKKDTLSNELKELSERLKNKKNEESVARYISEILGAPSSEIVSYGGATMVMADALSKYTLANHLLTQENPKSGPRGARRKYTKKEAYQLANETFIDYRYNLPKEIKTLSDYGILMFPAFWMKIQKVIAGLIKYHPVSALGGYAIEYAAGAESMNILNEALPIKMAGYGGLIHSPTEIIGPEALILAL